MIKLLSFLKLIVLALAHIIIFPIYLFLSKYDSYIFVLTTGRSGSNNLSNLFKNSNYVNANHEAYPIINNNYNFKNQYLKFWNGFTFYFVKVPKILLSHKKGNKIYLETNHLFLKSFSDAAVKVFKNKIKLIYLVRQSHLVAKSIYEIGRIPGTVRGDKWYLNPYKKENRLNFQEIFNRVNDTNKEEFKDFYKCCWYWYEIEARAIEFKEKHKLPFLELKTSELNDPKTLLVKINEKLNLNIPQSEITLNLKKVGKNLKADEKVEKISVELALQKTNLFEKAIL